MAEQQNQPDPPAPGPERPPEKRRRRSKWRILGGLGLILLALLLVARLALPSALRWYVNSALDKAVNYKGEIGDIDVHLWRGAYSIENISINKITGNVPVPLFKASRVDLAIQWDALARGKVVGRITMDQPELNFVAAEDPANSQSGAGGEWLDVIDDLFPFRINSAIIHGGSVHFRAFHTEPPVDLFLSHLEGSIENLTNIREETTPLISTINADATAMDQSTFQLRMKLDPNAYYPTFELGVKMIGLDVTKLNPLSLAYGRFDFKDGWFDLVIEVTSREGQLKGYVKPLFRNLQVFSLEDLAHKNPLQAFWQALIGLTTEVFKNQPRRQFGTVVPLRGDVTGTKPDILATVGGVLRNAFIRAYLPRFRGTAPSLDWLQFGAASAVGPGAPGDQP